jgi:hypothetical protein
VPVVLAGVLAAGCGGQGPVRIDAAPPSRADDQPCRELLESLPETVADLPARDVEPADAWGAAWGDPAVVLMCGSEPPAGFGRTSACTSVNGVDWYIPQEQIEGGGDITMTTVDRAQYVRVELPAEHFPPAAAMADLAGPVRQALRRTRGC